MHVFVGSVTVSHFKTEFYVHIAIIKSTLRKKQLYVFLQKSSATEGILLPYCVDYGSLLSLQLLCLLFCHKTNNFLHEF